MLKAIMFDLDDTLIWDEKSVDEAFRASGQKATQRYGVDGEAFVQEVKGIAPKLFATYDTYEFTKMIGISPFEGLWGVFDDKGEMPAKLKSLMPGYRKDVWTKGLQAFGIDDPAFGLELAETFQSERRKQQFVYEETFHVLDELKDDYQLLMLTNGSPDLQKTKLTITPELRTYFDHIVISGAFGKGKPDSSIFNHALALLGVEKHEALMVGDNLYTDILGASESGVRSVWINHHDQAKEIIPTYEITRLQELLPVVKSCS
ncbi:HAD family hydrolase [Lentibacillus cibarius]|uniref:Phosphoserine phosphatase n=1 Tax=Lentibacillus cibarius TaxID=2583219 RepID=A0A549YIH7_9BACI|nr:HAD family hydrolase [Lentibacillus cibarius]TRM11687.1 HAD family hydrolase [Lentibacillus cibarius]